MAYVYGHFRLDTDTLFYVGIGSDSKGKHTRAYSKKRRSKFWKDLIKETPYRVEILKDTVSWEEACSEEKRLIKLHGRRCLGTGTLCNITDGGEGVTGYRHSDVRKNIISKNSYGGKNGNAKPCIHFETGKRFESLKEGCKWFDLSYGKESCAVKRKYSTAKFYFEHDPFIAPTKEDISKKLGQLRLGNKNWKGSIKTKLEKNGKTTRSEAE
jgi:hypothetical protein